MPDNFDDFKEGIHRAADSAKRFDTSMGHAEINIRKIVASFIGADLVKKMASFATAQSATLTSMKTGFSGLQATASELVVKHKTLASDMREITALGQQRIAAGTAEADVLERQRRTIEAQLQVTRRQIVAKEAMAKFHPAELLVAAIALKAANDLYHTHTQISGSLIEANSSMKNRIGLTRDVLRVQQMLGTELSVSKEAARELVAYGYDLEESFQDSLKLVTQLHDGLGMSVSQATELVAVYDRQLKAPVREVADAMTRVVNDTALAADQAGRMAANIGRALAMLRPGVNKDFSAVNELVGRYEGALVKLGGQFGGFSEMLTKMTTPEGMMQAGMLGINNPEFLRSKDASKDVLDSFVAYAKRIVGDSSGWERALRLQVVADQFGVTAQQANLMIKAVDEVNNSTKTSLTLEERYREQVRASGQTFQRLGNALGGLMQQTAIPLLRLLTPLAGGIASVLEKLVALPGAVYVVGTAFVVVTALMVPRIWSAVTAFTALTASLIASARAAQSNAVAQLASNLPGGKLGGLGGAGAGAAVTGAVSRVVATLKSANEARFLNASMIGRQAFFTSVRAGLTPVGPMIVGALIQGLGILGAGIAGWKLGEWLYKKREGDQTKFTAVLKQGYDETLKAVFQRFAAKGDTEGIKNAMANARSVYAKRGYSQADIEAKLTRATEGFADIMGTARFRKETAESSIEHDPANMKASSDLANSQAEMISIADKQREAALKQIELAKESNRKEEERKEEELRNRRLNQNRYQPGVFMNRAYGY